MRLFIAINFPAEIKAAIAKIRNNIKNSALRGNFSFEENLHLTLVFLGECDYRQTEALKTVLNETVFSEFALTLDKIGCFKREGGDTWWIGLKKNQPLTDLQANLSHRLRQKGFTLEDRKYSPHITFGRQVKMRTGFVQPEIRQISCIVTGIELMKSERINSKLVYTQVFSKNANNQGEH